MKYKKYSYIVLFTLLLTIGVNKIYADEYKTCYYISSDENFKATVRIGFGYESANTSQHNVEDFGRATIFKTSSGGKLTQHKVKNWFQTQNVHGVTIEKIYNHINDANKDTNPECPQYIMYATCPTFFGMFDTKAVYVTNSELTAKSMIQNSGRCSYSAYASNYKDEKQITKEDFFLGLKMDGLIKYDESKEEYTCETMTELFGDKNKPDSIRYMLNEILGIVRIIVPILIILLGTIDFAKAVIAGKEDNMRKAQTDFIKRIIAGIAVFLVPTLVNVIMDLAEIAWQGTSYVSCDLL